MYLELENICGFQSAKVKVNGITVIAGNNNTGKSTIGKSLLLMFNSLHNLEEKIENDKIYAVEELLNAFFMGYRKNIFVGHLAELILKNKKNFAEKSDKIQHFIHNSVMSDMLRDNYITDNKEEIVELISSKNENLLNVCEKIRTTIFFDNDKYTRDVFDINFFRLFKRSVAHTLCKTDKSSIILTIKKASTKCTFSENKVLKFENVKDFYTQAIFIDNPFILDELETFNNIINKFDNLSKVFFLSYPKNALCSHILQKNDNISLKLLKQEGLKKVFAKLKLLNIGEIVRTHNEIKYNYDDKELDFINLSAGLKIFVIIKTLLLNGSLQENGTLILDEPEIHLHPEWQLVFAEILVLLQKTFGLHILLTTHSPYFVKAVETFAEKHKTQEKCHYYMTDCKESYCTIDEVTENTQVIYKKFYNPLRELERISSSD